MAVLKALLTGRVSGFGLSRNHQSFIILQIAADHRINQLGAPKSITPVQDTLQAQKRMQKNISRDLRKRCNCQRASPVLEVNAEPS